VIEDDAFAGQCIELRRAGVRAPVGADPIGARGIQRDDDEIQRGAVYAARERPEVGAAGDDVPRTE